MKIHPSKTADRFRIQLGKVIARETKNLSARELRSLMGCSIKVAVGLRHNQFPIIDALLSYADKLGVHAKLTLRSSGSKRKGRRDQHGRPKTPKDGVFFASRKKCREMHIGSVGWYVDTDDAKIYGPYKTKLDARDQVEYLRKHAND